MIMTGVLRSDIRMPCRTLRMLHRRIEMTYLHPHVVRNATVPTIRANGAFASTHRQQQHPSIVSSAPHDELLSLPTILIGATDSC